MYNNDPWNIDFLPPRSSIHMHNKQKHTHRHTQHHQSIDQLFTQSERTSANLIKFPFYFPPIRTHFRLNVRQLHQFTLWQPTHTHSHAQLENKPKLRPIKIACMLKRVSKVHGIKSAPSHRCDIYFGWFALFKFIHHRLH